MCGIAAVLADPAVVQFEQTIPLLLERLRHRGPDFSAAWRQLLGQGRELALLHTRLAIVDLSPAGRQPMHDPQNGNVIIFNGEIYNFRELRQELLRHDPGYNFRSASDTEVLLRGYVAWGVGLPARLDGMFTFILYDQHLRKLVIARDHVGIKPLYFTKISSGGWAFASEVRALLGSKLARPAIDPAGMASFLQSGSVAESSTICAGVRAFPAGSLAELSIDSGGELTPTKYWKPEDFLDGRKNAVEHAAVLESTVREQLVADVPVGIFLSAGIDSTALASTASRLLPGQIQAFTIRSGQGLDDEAELAGQTARQLRLPHVIEALSNAKVEGWVMDGIDAMDQPSSDGINTYLISRASRAHGMIAVLAGTGADELHGGYPHFGSLVRWQNPALAFLARQLGATLLDFSGRSTDAERLRLLLSAAPSMRAMLREKRRYFTPSWIARFAPAWGSKPEEDDNYPSDSRSLESRDAIALGELSGYLLNTLLRDSDWATMANGQELRVPFLGRRYVEYVLGLPWSVKSRIQNGPNKPLVSAVIPDGLQSVISRPKTGFELDYSALLCGPCRTSFVAAAQHLNNVGFVLDGERMLKDLAASKTRKDARRLWALLGLGSFLAKHGLVGC